MRAKLQSLSRFLPQLVLLGVLGCALLGMALVWYATTLGPGVGGDATIYITAARNLLAGNGLVWPEADGTFRLLPYSPPFYPIVLSALGLFGADIVWGARWLNIFLFGATIFLCGFYFYRFTGRVLLAGIVAGLAALSPVLIGVQVWAMTESLFLLLGFWGLFVLVEALHAPRRATLIFAAVLAGLAFLTRYAGLAFVLTGGLALLVFAREPGRRGLAALRAAMLYGAIALLPTLLWVAYSYAVTGSIASRSGQPAEAYWRRLLEMGPALDHIFRTWLIPEPKLPRLPEYMQIALWVALLVVMLALGGLAFRRIWAAKPAGGAHHEVGGPHLDAGALLVVVFGLFSLCYLAILTGVQVFTYPPVTLASRMLSPTHLAVLVLFFAVLHLAVRWLFGNSRWLLALVTGVGLVFLGGYLLRGPQDANGYHHGGMGYTTEDWMESGVVAAMRALPPDIPIVSNETTAVMYFAGRPSYPLLEIYQDKPTEPFTVYGTGDDKSQRAFREQGAALVLFNITLRSDFEMYGERVDERLAVLTRGLRLVYKAEDGAIYFWP